MRDVSFNCTTVMVSTNGSKMKILNVKANKQSNIKVPSYEEFKLEKRTFKDRQRNLNSEFMN